jgi:hypothetical protein
MTRHDVREEPSMTLEIKTTNARLDDPATMATFLAPIPNADGLAQVLSSGEPVSTRAFDDASFTARFVASDGAAVRCFTVVGISIDQAELIALACERIDPFDEHSFREAAQQALKNCPDLPA